MPETRSGAQTAQQEISAREVAEALNLKIDAYQEKMDKRLSETYEAIRQMLGQSSRQHVSRQAYNTRHSRSVSAMKTANGKDKAKEALKPVDDIKVGKRKAPTEKLSKRETRKFSMSKKDRNKPKRPPTSAFKIFHGDFTRKNPDARAFPAIFYAATDKWNSMSQAEKAPYEEKAAKRNAEYEKLMDAFSKNMKKGSDEPEKSRSDVNDEDEAIDEEELLEKGKAGDKEGEEMKKEMKNPY